MKKTLLMSAISLGVFCFASGVASAADAPAMEAPEPVVVAEEALVKPPAMEEKAAMEEMAVEVKEEVTQEVVQEVAVVEAEAPKTVVKWGYVGDGAAHKWGSMGANFALCSEGKEQSPINIEAYKKAEMYPLNAAYQPVPLEVVNNGHTVQVNYAPGSTIELAGKSFELLQFHFHTPSEHYIDGAPFPMEAHFVHQALDGTIGIIGVMMKIGEHNPVIEGIWQNVPASGQVKKVETVSLNAADLLPASKDSYAYRGSLTEPPCTEGVLWHIMKEPITLSEAQLTAFQSVFPVNSRPVQALGERFVIGN